MSSTVTEPVQPQGLSLSTTEHLRLVIDTIPGLVWSALPDGSADYFNRRWLEFAGLKPGQASGWGWQTVVHPDDLPGLTDYWKTLLASGDAGETEARLRRSDGVYRWFLFRAVPLRDDTGRILKWYGQNTDIDERKRAAIWLAGEKQLLEMIAGDVPLPPILERLCLLAEQLTEGVFVSILLVSSEGKRLQHGAGPSLPRPYREAIDGGFIGPCAGSCGTAAHRREPVFVSDIATDPLWADYRQIALPHGLRACWSTPVFSSAREVLGTFAFYLPQPGGPTAAQRKAVEQFAHLASIAIERTRAQEALPRSEAYLAEAQRLSRTGSFGWRISTGELVWSEETYCIMGYERTLKPTLEMVLQRVHPGDVELVRQTIERASRDRTQFDFEHRLLLPDGALKHVHVVARAVDTQSGDVEFVGAIMDVTEQKQLEHRLRRSEKNLAEGQRLTRTGSWILDFHTGNTDWSLETCRIFGFPDPPPSPHYREFRERVRPEDRDGVDRGLRESYETGEPRPLRYVFILPDGTRKDIETISEPVRDEAGRVVKLMGTVMDVTERQRAEDALRASELLARGQLNALTRTLDSLASESEPDRFLYHVLRNITHELHAHSSSVWRRDAADGLMHFEFAFEDGRLVNKAEAAIASVSPPLRIEDVHPWPEIFRTGKPCVLSDIRAAAFPWRDRLMAMGVVAILTVPMIIAGQVEGVIGIRFTSGRTFDAAEMELAQAFANQAMLAMQLNRLSAQSRQTAVMAERNRMARDIHDTLAQGFTGVIVQLEAAKGAAARNDSSSVAQRIGRADDLARSSLAEARRSVRALRPRSLRDGTLCMALEDLLKRMANGPELNAEFQVEGEQRALPADWEEALLRVAQESLTNTIKHARAKNFRAALSFHAGGVALQMLDDGGGFNPHTEHDGFGLIGMRERMEQLGGQFTLRSKPDQGTEIIITLASPTPASTPGSHEQT
jgi:PAS domain S-box-containing protein